MADTIPRSQQAAAALRWLLRAQAVGVTRSFPTSPVASTSYHTLATNTIRTSSSFIQSTSPYCNHTKNFTSSTSTNVSAHRKQAGREKARLRAMRQEEKFVRRREKDNYPTRTPRPPRNAEEEGVESTIREYMAKTGPRGERLTRAQQERLLKQELRELGHQLEKVDKKAKVDEATQDLPPLDDQTLDELYQALMLPPLPTAEEVRLARLEDGRRERSVLGNDADGRGRRRLEKLPGSCATLPPSPAEARRVRTSMDLKQKLIDAREKGRMLLPPSTSAAKSETDRERELQLTRESKEVEEDGNMAALPHAERQEIRLQQLFARLAVVHESAEVAKPESGPESLQQIKSSLANKIAKILQEHNYELHPNLQKQQQEHALSADEQPAGADGEEVIPPFEPVHLDAKAPLLQTTGGDQSKVDSTDTLISLQDRSDLVARAEAMISDLSSEESRKFMLGGIERIVQSATTADASSSTTTRLPLGVATMEEWTALAVSSARAGDDAVLSRTLSLMQTAGYHPAPLSLYNDIIDVYASRGEVGKCQEWVSQVSEVGLSPDDHTYHSLVKAYVNSTQFLPAIQLLNSLEASGHPASMATYTMVINRLLDPVLATHSGSGLQVKEERPELQALAWNVFYHMRLHAHPIPDAPLYALMIRACARGIPQPHEIDDPTRPSASSSRISDAERAFDLFREMTTRYSVRPNAETYNALILACARRRDFYLEAFRLLREMVELETERAHIPAAEVKMPRFAPDRYTFNALLQGCARNRDLPRARWVLAEMIRTTLPFFDEDVRKRLSRAEGLEMLSKRPNEETMCHVFHTYAAYVPPLKRAELQLQKGAREAQDRTANATLPGNVASEGANTTAAVEATQQVATTSVNSDIEPTKTDKDEDTTAEEAAQIFSALVPQTSSDILSESRSLFARILADQPRPSPSSPVEGPLGGVKPGVRLVNAYLTVLAAHLPSQYKARVLHSVLSAPPQSDDGESGLLESGLFARIGLEPNEHSFRIILEALSDIDAGRAPESTAVLADIWTRFETFVASRNSSAGGSGATDVTTRAHQAEIKLVDALQVKKCWSACIHFWAKNSDIPTDSTSSSKQERTEDGLDTAMDLLRRFAALYPPYLAPRKNKKAERRAKASLQKSLKTQHKLDLSPLPLPLKSLQTLQALSSSSPLVSEEIAEEKYGEGEGGAEGISGMEGRPKLGFLDVQLLHHRLVRYGRIKDLAYLSWVLHRYSASR